MTSPVKDIEIGSVAGRCMLVNLDMHAWGAYTSDRNITEDVRKRFSTDGNYTKKLIPSSALTEVRSAFSVVERIHKEMTLPWGNNGERILNSALYLLYRERMLRAIEEANKASDSFVSKYEGLVEQKRATENGTFNEKNYPSKTAMRKKFGIEVHYAPVPQGNDIRLELSNDALAAVRETIDADQQSRIKGAVFEIAQRVNAVVGHMVNRLKDYKPSTDDSKAENRFQDTLIENVRDLAELIPHLNITGDQRITNLANQLKDIAQARPYKLRSDGKLREKTVAAAEKVLAKINDFI